MGIGTVTSTGIQVYVGGCHVEGCQAINPNNSHQNDCGSKERGGKSNFMLVNAAWTVFKTNMPRSVFKTNSLLKPNNQAVAAAAIVTHAHEKVADGMGVAAGAAVVATGLIAFAKSCVTVASGVAASVLLVMKQSLDAARPTTATPDL